MAILLLVRHGQNDMVGKKLAGRLPDVHLNEHGQAQARRLAAEFAILPIKAVFASPLERAVETAEPIARVHALSVAKLPALLEIDFGDWEGKSLKRLKRGRLWRAVQGNPSAFRFPNGESFVEAQKRIADALHALSENFGEKEMIVCVGHSDMIRLAVSHYLGQSLDYFQRLRIDPASVSVLYLDKKQTNFGTINHSFDFPKSMN